MSSSVSTSTGSTLSYEQAMDQIRSQLESSGVSEADLEAYLGGLDGTFDLSVIDNPALQAYFQLAYTQLVEILDPELINSLEASVGSVDFQTLYDAAGDDFNEMVKDLIEDDPELMALYATQAGGASEGEYLLDYLTVLRAADDTTTAAEEESLFTDDARALAETFDLGEGFDWLIDQEDMFKAAEESILTQLTDYDQAMRDLLAQFESGEISETAYESELQSMSYGREALLTLLQQVSEQEMSFFELISKLYDAIKDTQLAIVSNQRI